jgi:ferredoxin--NADP+ reductase
VFEILRKEQLTPETTVFEVYAPQVARKCEPGNFIMLRIDERGERIPLTVADFNPDTGTVTIIFQKVGKSTHQLAKLDRGDLILDFVGPLGKHMEIGRVGTVVAIGGGLGIAPIFLKIRFLVEAGNEVTAIIGARSKNLLILEKEISGLVKNYYVTTDDGTYGLHGFVTDQFKALLDQGLKPDLVLAVGPIPMMKAVSKISGERNLRTLVSLDTIMVDGTGMCGSCRITVGGKSLFACVDGPVFDGLQVDYDEYSARQQRYRAEEKRALEEYICRCRGKDK